MQGSTLKQSSYGVGKLAKDEVKDILTKYKTVAIVGLSKDPSKDSHRVAEYLKDNGFSIVPINPSADNVLGEKSYKSLIDVPVEIQKTIEIVDIFRPSPDIPNIVEQAVKLKERFDKPYVVWMQLGIVNEKAAESARKAGLIVIANKCLMQEHRKLLQNAQELR